MDAWMCINKIDDGDKVDAFISLVCPEVDILVALVSPANTEAKTYVELSTLLEKHYMSGMNELAESYSFDTRLKKKSVTKYIVALKKICFHCGFGAEEQVKKRLRNRLVAGARSDSIKNRLLSEGAALTWERAVEIGVYGHSSAKQ